MTWSLSSDVHPEEYVDIYLYKNGWEISESHHFSRYTGPSGFLIDQGNIYKTHNIVLKFVQEAVR